MFEGLSILEFNHKFSTDEDGQPIGPIAQYLKISTETLRRLRGR